jgi:hypothetical protein
MITTSIARLLVPAALLILPVAGSAQAPSSKTIAQVAQNNVAALTRAPEAAPTVNAAAPVAEKKICKLLPSSYSRMNKRACLTANEWKQVEENSQ